ncbi:MAG: hypothetical protein KDD68_18600, partial [Bdellovibrionales bacterium]|nr:hypothetical protein [Bdellovibrionales bacterium]
TIQSPLALTASPSISGFFTPFWISWKTGDFFYTLILIPDGWGLHPRFRDFGLICPKTRTGIGSD